MNAGDRTRRPPFCESQTDRFSCTLTERDHGPWHVAETLSGAPAAVWPVLDVRDGFEPPVWRAVRSDDKVTR